MLTHNKETFLFSHLKLSSLGLFSVGHVQAQQLQNKHTFFISETLHTVSSSDRFDLRVKSTGKTVI